MTFAASTLPPWTSPLATRPVRPFLSNVGGCVGTVEVLVGPPGQRYPGTERDQEISNRGEVCLALENNVLMQFDAQILH